MSAPERIFDGAALRAVLWPGKSGRLVVTFDYRSRDKADFSPDTHSTGFARMGHAQLSIKTRANDWFINAETAALEQVLRGLGADYRNVCALGYSMGGYGAFRFAAALGINHLVAVSPQVAPLGPDAPWEWRYRDEARAYDAAQGALSARPHPAMRGQLLYDPFEREDRLHARALQQLFAGIELVALPFGGHPSTRVLRGAGEAWRVQRAATGQESSMAIRAAHRAGRRDLKGYWRRLARQAAWQHPGLARQAQAMAAALPEERGDDL